MILLPHLIPLPEVLPPTTTATIPSNRLELQNQQGWEFVGREIVAVQEDDCVLDSLPQWEVEHYRAYSYAYDDRGLLHVKQPLPEKIHLRYWRENPP